MRAWVMLVRGVGALSLVVVFGLLGVVPGIGVALAAEAPTIVSAKSSGETRTTAQLEAEVNPGGEETSYQFEYGTSTAYGTKVPIPDGKLEGGSSEVLVTEQLTKLEENTEYHWRVIAVNTAGTTVSVDHTFVYSTGNAGLPDGREYEMVSPPQKNGAVVGGHFGGLLTQIAENGARVFTSSLQCLPGAESCGLFNSGRGASLPVGLARTSSGWASEPLTPPATEFEGDSLAAANATAGTELFEVPVAAGNGVSDWYGRTPNNKFFRIGPLAESPAKAFKVGELATANLSHILYNLESKYQYWAFDPTLVEDSAVYEYEGPGNTSPRLVAIAPGSNELVSRCGAVIGGGRSGGNDYQQGALSEDGETVYFTALPCPAGLNDEHVVRARAVYVRYEHTRSELVSGPAPSGAPPAGGEACNAACQSEPQGTALFEGASSDGSRVFFIDPHRLTNRASEDTEEPPLPEQFEPGCTETPAGLTGCNLYESECPDRCKNPSDRRLVAVSAGDTSGEGPRVLGVVAISGDGSHVYFAAQGVLTGANSEGHAPVAGGPNLYVYERDARFPEGHLAFIAAVSSSVEDESLWLAGPGVGVANVTPDGRFLVFHSEAALTADDTRPLGPAQIYRYDAETEALLRVSIGANGFADDGNEGTGNSVIVPASNTLQSKIEPVRTDPTMSNDGNFVFFESTNGLTPHALNDLPTGRNGRDAWNVYEWEAPGTQVNGSVSCSEPTGCVYLISDGKDVAETGKIGSVELLGSDGSGANVFFTSSDQLVSQDTDTERDFYDAHACSSSEPCVHAVEALPPCLGEVCHGIPAEQRLTPTGGSLTLNGLGNLSGSSVKVASKRRAKPVKCRKGFTRKHGRCVRVKKAKAKAKRANYSGRGGR